MNEPKLARMANQVAAFFRSYPDEEAASGIRGHLRSFWTKNMIRDLTAYAAEGAADVDPLVAKAMLAPSFAEDPARKAMAGPESAGVMVSDAG